MRTGRFFVDTEAAGYGLQGGHTIEQMGNSAPDVVDDETQIILRLIRLFPPVRDDLMNVQNRLIDSVTYVIEERDFSSEFPANPCLMVPAHGNDDSGLLDQVARQFPLTVRGGSTPSHEGRPGPRDGSPAVTPRCRRIQSGTRPVSRAEPSTHIRPRGF